MDHSPFRQTFELGIFTSTAGKSILNLVKWGCLVAEHCKMLKICAEKCNHISKSDYTFPRLIQKYTKFANFTELYFLHFTMFFNQTSQFY